MLSIILLILKIIGITLLVILGIILLVVLLVLLVPIRYQIKANRSGLAEAPPIEVHGVITWLFRILNIHVDYPGKKYLRVRILFFSLFSMPTDPKTATKKKEKKSKEKTPKEKKRKNKQKEEPTAPFTQECLDQEAHTTKEGIEDILEVEKDEALESENLGDQEFEKDKVSIFDKVSNFKEKISNFFQTIEDKLEHIENTIAETEDKIAYYEKVFQSKAFQESLSLCKKELIKIFKEIFPKKCKIYSEIGLEDPAATAQILSIYGMLYSLLYGKVYVQGNFNEQVIKLQANIKGKITIGKLLCIAIRVYFNKNIRRVIKMLKKGGAK